MPFAPEDTDAENLPARMDAIALAKPLVQRCESCVLRAYPDPESPRAAALRMAPADRPALWWRNPGDPWTIGWGHTGRDVVEGMVWTQDKADQQLELDLADAAVWAFKLVHQPYAIHVFAALTSFIFNVGAKDFAGSTMHFLLASDYVKAAAEFPRWDHAKGKVVEGLLKRRLAEQALFLGKDWKQAIDDFEASHAS